MDYLTRYEKHTTNAEIAASASATFFVGSDETQNKDKWGSFNYLEIINDGDIDIKFQLDGLSTRERKLFGKSVVVIKAEENIFFNTLKITNTSGADAIAAGDINIVARIMSPIISPVVSIK